MKKFRNEFIEKYFEWVDIYSNKKRKFSNEESSCNGVLDNDKIKELTFQNQESSNTETLNQNKKEIELNNEKEEILENENENTETKKFDTNTEEQEVNENTAVNQIPIEIWTLIFLQVNDDSREVYTTNGLLRLNELKTVCKKWFSVLNDSKYIEIHLFILVNKRYM